MTNPTPLSPAAQAVLNAAEDAYGYNYSEFHCCADRVAAAALRAAADQVVPPTDEMSFQARTMREVRFNLFAIAAELEDS